jgi:glutamate 5-kinase
MPQSSGMEAREQVSSSKRIVIKVGSSSITHETGRLDLGRIEKLSREIADLMASGKEVVLVSSGAVAAGLGKLGLKEKPKTIPEKQAVAAVGQGVLIHIYGKVFGEYSQTVAQVLLTREDTIARERCLNSRNTLLTLLGMGVLPVINENDAVAVDELKIGENDTLSAMVASLIDADLLIILSDIDGLYTANPASDPGAILLHQVGEIDEKIEASCGGAGSARGTGGMFTKVQAAKIATSSGIPLVIANSKTESVLHRVVSGEPLGTLFSAKENGHGFKKRWISFGAKVEGSVSVDSGCEKSVVSGGKSLLPAGLIGVEGEFGQGAVVKVLSASGRELGRGMVNYSSEELLKIKGKHSDEIADILGAKPYDEAIHRDHLAILV